VTAESTAEPVDPEDMNALFPESISAQRRVANAGLQQKFVLVTGGPGTGKTTVAGRLLVLLVNQRSDLRIALAAPTGKAAVRLGEAIGDAVTGLGSRFSDVAPRLETIAGTACTLHRLLGWQPGTGRCRFHADNPLPYDVIVVDEASMLDLMLWDRLLEAMAPDTRLVILGDHRQLASVQPGRVLGELVVAADEGLLDGTHVELDHNYRFDADAEIGLLADAVRDHDGDTALQVLRDSETSGDALLYGAAALDEALDAIWPHVLNVVRSTTPEMALEALARVRVLCALNKGPFGAAGMNARIENRLQQGGVVIGARAHGRPVIVRVNDRQHSGLLNGDVGVVLRGVGDHESGVYFPVAGTREIRRVSVEAMPRHETAWALTVHRSQGSEFDAVLLVLPRSPHELVTPELVYTGVTRARSRVIVVADDVVIRAACGPRDPRRTGLFEKLRAQ
jgi:exodeoxyribonuclease V alpha subunit